MSTGTVVFMSDIGAAAGAVRKSKGAVVVSVIVMLAVFGWLIVVGFNIGAAPAMSGDGKTVLYDRFLRTKEIFALILPLLTTAVGFWLGSQGTVHAQNQASYAQNRASEAQNQAMAAKDQTARALEQQRAVISVASSMMPRSPDILAEAKKRHREAFENWKR
jgi:hypothetical protein